MEALNPTLKAVMTSPWAMRRVAERLARYKDGMTFALPYSGRVLQCQANRSPRPGGNYTTRYYANYIYPEQGSRLRAHSTMGVK